MLGLLNAFKVIKENEKEAERMVREAQTQAERIRSEAQQKAETTYEKTWKAEIIKVERQCSELKEKARERAKAEAEVYLRQAEEKIKEIRGKAEKK